MDNRILIREDLAIATPAASEVLEREGSSRNTKRKRLIVQIAAIHEGITKNHNLYTAQELREATPSWMTPYPKPILINHDINAEPLGRMINSSFESSMQGRGYIKLRAAIGDPNAAAKIIDGRYLTGSVGGIPTAAICSICHQDVVSMAREGIPHEHQRGHLYEGQTCVYEHRGISFHEYSFVNAPGDSFSQIQGHVGESAELHLYSVDMENGTIAEFNAGANSFVDMREMFGVDAAESAYYEIAYGTKYSEKLPNSNETQVIYENNMNTSTIDNDTNEPQAVESEVSDEEELTEESSVDKQDLKEEATEEVATEEKTEDAAEEVVEATETEEVEEVETEEADATEDKVEEAEVEEAEDTAEQVEEVEESAEEAEATAEEAEEVTPEVTEEADKAVDNVTEAELLEELERLREENKSMKEYLHTELVERVVDARIAAGLIKQDDRVSAIEQYSGRGVASLRDALADTEQFMESIGKVPETDGTVPELEEKAYATDDETGLSEFEGEEVVEESAAVDPEDIFVSEFSRLLLVGEEKFRKERNS